MAREGLVAVFDSGPLIHLNEVGGLEALRVLKKALVAPEVVAETGAITKTLLKLHGKVFFPVLSATTKDLSKTISQNYSLELGESESIALCRQEGIELLLTDDLQARTTAKSLSLKVHSTVGIVLRAAREGVFPKSRAISIMKDLREKSSLFITADLIRYALNELEREL